MSVAVSVHDGTDIHSRSSSGRGLVVLIHTNPHVIHTHTRMYGVWCIWWRDGRGVDGWTDWCVELCMCVQGMI